MTIEQHLPEDQITSDSLGKAKVAELDKEQSLPSDEYGAPFLSGSRPWRTLRSASTNEYRLSFYVDRITKLLLEYHLRGSEQESEVRQVARALTQHTLRALDGTYKGDLIHFLDVSDLISGPTPIILLRDAVLTSVQLNAARLPNVNLRFCKLIDAELIGASLNGAD